MEGLCILLGDKYREFILQEMTISVNYNASTLTLNRSLSNATFALSKALNRMSTGFRVNSAADDAAGLYVATGMRTQIGGLNQAKKNTQIGVNLLNTAQGGLSEMNKLLSRIRDLSVQASNGVYGKNERDAMQKEIDALTEQYNQIKKGTNFNGLYLFETPENTGVTTYASTLASRLSTNSNWKVNAPKDSSSVPERTPPLSAPKAPVSQEEPPTENLPSVGEITPEEGELPEPEPYNPGVQLTGKEMNALKSWLAAGEKYEDFSASIANGMSAAEILSSKGIEQTTNKALRAADPKSGAGTVDFNGGETKVVAIEGVNYTIKNTQPIAKSIIWSKNDAGEITFEGTNFEIRGQSDASHNVNITGNYMALYGGDKNDILTLSTGAASRIYAGGGNDIVNAATNGNDCSYYLERGDNTLNITGGRTPRYIYGGTGNDTFNLNTVAYLSALAHSIKTGGGNNTINFNSGASNWRVDGGSGNNTYNVNSTNVNGLILFDPDGNNVVNNNANNVQPNNSISGNFTVNGTDKFIRALAVDFAAGETRTVTLSDGKKYTIKNNNAVSDTMIWKMVGDRLTLAAGSKYTITALEKSKISLNVAAGENIYYCSLFGDDVTSHNDTIYTGSADNVLSMQAGNVFCEGGDNTITVLNNTRIFAKEGNNTINVNSYLAGVWGGSGNNTFNINTSNAAVFGGSGNDVFNIKAGVTGVSCIGGGGTNTVKGNIAGAQYLADMSNAVNNATSVLLPGNISSSVDVDIDGSVYSFKNGQSVMPIYAAYSLGVDGTVSVLGGYINVTADSTKHNKIEINGPGNYVYGGNSGNTFDNYGYGNYIYGGEGDDIFNAFIGAQNLRGGTNSDKNKWGNDTFNCYGGYINITAGNGNNKFVINAGALINTGTGNNHYVINQDNLTFNGGNGNNIYEINANNCNITGGTGKDTFQVNGDNNQVFGAAGDDYFIISSGAANNVIGGSGTNYIIDNGIGTTNPTGDVINDPNSGLLSFTDNVTSQSVTLFGKTYKVTNTTTEGALLATNSLRYSYNINTGEISFYGSNFTIEASDDINHDIVVKGSNNVIVDGNGNDKITVMEGSNNKIQGTAGNNTIIANTSGNKLIGGSGNDIFNVNADSNIVNSTAGKNTININSSLNTILGGTGVDSINIKGNDNTIDGGDGDDNVIAIGNNNIINSSQGSNNLVVKGEGNSIVETGNGNNTVAVDGENNNVTLGNGNNKVSVITSNTVTTGNTITTGNGNNSFNVKGNKNQITTGTGQDSFDLNGNDNKINSGDGNNTVNVTFGTGNTIDTGSGADKITVKSDSNLVKSGAGNDSITVSGNQNNVSSSSGENNFQINGNNNQIQGGSDKDNIYLTGDNNIAKGGDGNDRFNIRLNAKDNNIDGEIGNNTMINYGTDTVFANVKDITSDIEIRLQVGANGDANSAIFFKTDFIAEDLIVDVSSVDNALAGIELLDNIINTISEKRSELGAVESRLDSVLTSQTTQVENLTAAVSTIMDVDIAEESALYVKNQILQQSSAALMSASANFSKNLVLQLLQ